MPWQSCRTAYAQPALATCHCICAPTHANCLQPQAPARLPAPGRLPLLPRACRTRAPGSWTRTRGPPTSPPAAHDRPPRPGFRSHQQSHPAAPSNPVAQHVIHLLCHSTVGLKRNWAAPNVQVATQAQQHVTFSLPLAHIPSLHSVSTLNGSFLRLISSSCGGAAALGLATMAASTVTAGRGYLHARARHAPHGARS